LLLIRRVRATYTSDRAKSVPIKFLADREVASDSATSAYPPIIHITKETYTPCLSVLQLKCLDGLLRAAKMLAPPKDSAMFALKDGNEKALGFDLYGMDKDERDWKKAHYGRECAGCRQAFSTTKLRKCGGCYMQQYCR
jgi:hypothetical protein